MSATAQRKITLSYQVPAANEDWVLSEEPVPESQPHDLTVELIRDLLAYWIVRTARDAQVARNLAVRWDREHYRIGVDPDVCLIEPRTPEGEDLESLCTWERGHHPPTVAFEVVSSNPNKDYARSPEKHAAAGVFELVVFDARLRGPRAFGGPYRMQVWRRMDDGGFERVHAGEGPFFLQKLNAWVFAVDEGRRLRIADDRNGTSWWRTAEEAERAAKEAERAAKEAALARVAELEAELRKR
jgi:hypothetical protein